MLDELISQPLFLLLLVAFLMQLLIIIITSRKGIKRGLEWLYAKEKSVERKQRNWLKPVARAFRSAFSAGESEMKRKFIASGFYNTRFAIYYMPLKYLLLFSGVILLLWLSYTQGWKRSDTMLFCALWAIISLIMPDLYLKSRSHSLVIRVSNKLPYMIDLLAVCVQTGMTIEASMEYLSQEMKDFDPDLGYQLNKTKDRTKVVGLETALDEMFERVPSNEMRSFVITLKQSVQYGSSIYQVLTTLSSEIREVQMLTIEEKIGKLAAKMSVPLMLFIMFPIVILIAAPGIMRLMSS